MVLDQEAEEKIIESFIKLYNTHCQETIENFTRNSPDEKQSLYIDYDVLYEYNSNFAKDYREHPYSFQNCAEEALQHLDLSTDANLKNAHVRVKNLPETIDSISYHDIQIGELVAIKGIIAESGDKGVNITNAAFKCELCRTMNHIPQQSRELQEPNKCRGCERAAEFNIDFDQSEMVDKQQFILRSTEADISKGEEPLEIPVYLQDDLVGMTAGNYIVTSSAS